MPSIRSLYKIYCAMHSQANDRLRELLADPKHAAYFAECWNVIKSSTHAWDLGSMLIKPVQRVMKYPMLFTSLLACTEPSHLDYPDLVKAAEGARAIAEEINQEKGKKDGAGKAFFPGSKRRNSHNNSVPTVDRGKGTGGVSLKIGKRFRKDKDKSTRSDDAIMMGSGNLADSLRISIKAEEELRLHIRRLESAEKVVRRVGKEVNALPEGIRRLWTAQRSLIGVWLKVASLDDTEPADERVSAFAALVDGVLQGPLLVLVSLGGSGGDVYRAAHADFPSAVLAVDPQEAEITSAVMPLFSRLLRMAVNPRLVVSRLDGKRADYLRVTTSRSKADLHKQMDRAVLLSAQEFFAIHSQLLEELPRFLAAYSKILDLALVAFADAQARFHAEARNRLSAFMADWRMSEERAGIAESVDGRSVVKRWHETVKPVMDALDVLECVHGEFWGEMNYADMPPAYLYPGNLVPVPVRSSHSRNQSLNDLHSAAPTISRSFSRVTLSRNSSFSRLRDLTSSRPTSPTGQERLPIAAAMTSGRPPRPARVRSSSLMNQVLSAAGVGRPASQSTAGGARPPDAIVVASPATDVGGFSLVDKESANSLTAAAASRRRDSDGMSLSSFSAVSPGAPSDAGSAFRTPNQLGSPFSGAAGSDAARSPRLDGDGVHRTSSWSDEPALYKCVCVAPFSVEVELWYAGLPFLNPLKEGDVVDILHEVGRVDTLEDLPIDVGVPDDGLLVGRSEEGRVGVLLCSYAMPLV
jgi:hypothetical protein